ncbi:acyl-CoA dehydrogenase family protein [Arthrobacter sp. FW306-2-2C-D06B]|uniref:acyl-CoA dehydrogenase family protein n=1 Tax=Arthrobacter sp. FW306-2-2C-D06B TaxID=2879618 RepID=UPI001F46F90D|nr:acyl-CoA dehydrogenase family protein [Arthrobacter sp. FW306-2-2C-D06B]UKA58572.1 acyl-CoA dehydrogenase family protein [Arthrobacter sp. FW306-2-2C-D06B]
MTTTSDSTSEELDAVFPDGAAFPAGTMEPEYVLNESLDPDPASVFKDISREDRAYWDRARTFVRDEVLPVITGYWERAEYPLHLVKRLGELDLLRDGINIDGFPAMSKTAAGLVTMELSRGDGSIGTVVAVQGGLALRSVAECGSREQQARWLPSLARAEEYGAFALTEPAHGSDSVGLETTATSVEGGYALNGEKKWIGNGSIGGLTVVWARGDDGQVHGYLVPQDSAGYSATTIEGKLSLRAIWQAHIRLENVFVPAENVLPGARTFKDTARVLLATRLGVAWSAVGHATACYETAVQYAAQRRQFGRPLAASQIVQERLARMQSELATMQLMVMQMTRLDEEGVLTPAQAALAKFTCTRTARGIASNARDLLGGNGILLANRVARHFADIEGIHTYEGTETVQALIIGRSITGISAFA